MKTTTVIQAHVRNGVIVPDRPHGLPDGAAVEVRMVEIPSELGPAPSMLELLARTPPPGLHRTSADADQYVRRERNCWDN